MADTGNISANTSSCPTFEGSFFYAIDVIGLLYATFSILTSSSVIFFIIFLKWWTIFNQRLILYLSIATSLGLFAAILSRVAVYGFCSFGGFVTQVGGWIVINAYICITATLLLKLFFTVNLERLDLPTVLFIFVLPLLFNWIPFINNTFGQAGPVCWIKYNEEVNGTCQHNIFGIVLQFVLWYVPVYGTLIIMIVLYAIILVKFCLKKEKWKLSNRYADNDRRQALKYTVSLLVYPLVYFAINLFPFISRIYGLLKPENAAPVLWLLSALSFSSQGPGIAIVFFIAIHKKLTRSGLKAALDNWRMRTTMAEEYDVRPGREKSISTKVF